MTRVVDGGTSPQRATVTTLALRRLGTWVLGSALFVGVPFVSWHAGTSRPFFDDAGRLAYVVLALSLNLYAAIRIPEIGKTRSNPEVLVGRQRWAVLFLQVLSVAAVIVAPWSDATGRGVMASETLRFAGVAVYGCGFLLMHWAEATLGRQFSMDVAIQKEHELVTTGLYRYVRHPRYVGIELLMIGLALVFRSASALALPVLVALVLGWRIHDEEILMERAFGERWRAYVRQSWRLVPWVY